MNNHTFLGRTKDGYFAFAHNGVLYNDRNLKDSEGLPKTCIETDSYVSVQLLEKYGELNFETIAKMSEEADRVCDRQREGSDTARAAPYQPY